MSILASLSKQSRRLWVLVIASSLFWTLGSCHAHYNHYDSCSSANLLLSDAQIRTSNIPPPSSEELDANLSKILDQEGADLRQLRDFTHLEAPMTIPVSQRAWQLMRAKTLGVIDEKLGHLSPVLMDQLKLANVSSKCLEASQKTIEAARRLESWAVQLVAAWGSFPPTGIFEGTYGDIGSYHGCLNVPGSKAVAHTQYCSISFGPVMPKRKDYEVIVRRVDPQLLHLFNSNKDDANSGANNVTETRDAFSDLLEDAQYYSYVYYKLGTCIPIECSPFDVQLMAKTIGKSWYLITGPVKCYSKHPTDYPGLQVSARDLYKGVYVWKPNMPRAHLWSIVIVCALAGCIVLLTAVDLIYNVLPKWYLIAINSHQRDCSRASSSNHHHQASLGFNTAKEENLELLDTNNITTTTTGSNGKSNGNAHENGLTNTITNGYTTNSNGHPNGHPPNGNSSGNGHANGVHLKAQAPSPGAPVRGGQRPTGSGHSRGFWLELVKDCSIIRNVAVFFHIDPKALARDITCIHGIRCITMSWIIVTHTMQFNDWSGFARTKEVETHLKSLINQPIFNATYLVDTFFLVSGLVTAYSSFRLFRRDPNVGSGTPSLELVWSKFSSKAYLVNRYLRLTPQIMLVSLLFIVLPQLSKSGSPHWYTMTGEYSEYCVNNWWMGLFYIQAFYRSNEMCNFVCWWISADMMYHLVALCIIMLVCCYGHKRALRATLVLIAIAQLYQVATHYRLSLPPNLLSTIPQSGKMWSNMTLKFFWTPYAHAFPFFLGFYVGYLMAQRDAQLRGWFTYRKSCLGWLATMSMLLVQQYSTYFWVTGRWTYTPLVSTVFYSICPLVWACCVTWIILACKYGYGGFIDNFLSCKLFIVLSRASFLVYLSHLLVLSTYYGSQNLLIEPTQLVMLYIMIGNICISMLFGSLLCIVFELPWLNIQRKLVRLLR